jgi:5-methylcytosine-specific restriction endonuclease McrA
MIIDSKILLSSTEREALFRASQNFLDSNIAEVARFADDLCDRLDDGGIWNPCFIVINEIDLTHGYSQQFCFNLIVKSGKRDLESHSHALRMIYDRYQYTNERSTREDRSSAKPPWMMPTRAGYYGPNWETVRKRAISRDDGKCVDCGMDRDEHKRKTGKDLHVHHITPMRVCATYAEANELENLKTVCRDCHPDYAMR